MDDCYDEDNGKVSEPDVHTQESRQEVESNSLLLDDSEYQNLQHLYGRFDEQINDERLSNQGEQVK